jgi:hypothetical protein
VSAHTRKGAKQELCRGVDPQLTALAQGFVVGIFSLSFPLGREAIVIPYVFCRWGPCDTSASPNQHVANAIITTAPPSPLPFDMPDGPCPTMSPDFTRSN